MSRDPRGVARELYDLVQETRALKGWTTVRLHKESGVSRSTIDKWRTQQRPPLAGKVIAVADALGINRRLALELGHVLPPDNEPVIDPAIAELVNQLRDRLEGAPPAVRRVIADLLGPPDAYDDADHPEEKPAG